MRTSLTANGRSWYDLKTKILKIRLDQVKVSFLNITGKVFKELEENQNDNIKVERPYIYIQNGPWYYISRAFVYSFGSNNQSRMLPVKGGSVYYEKNVWIPFAFNKKEVYSDYLDRYYNMLKYPLTIKEDIETYPESPEGWLVPILTEPFDEGVEGAVKRKR